MAKDPAFLFYSSDFLTGTMFMTNEQVGIYIKLLCCQHQHGGFILKHDFENMVAGHEILRKKFIETKDAFYNERLATEMNLRKEKSKNKSEAKKRYWEQKNTTVQKNDTTVLKVYQKNIQTEDENINENEIENKEGGMGETKPAKEIFADFTPPKIIPKFELSENQIEDAQLYFKNQTGKNKGIGYILETWQAFQIQMADEKYKSKQEKFKHFLNSQTLKIQNERINKTKGNSDTINDLLSNVEGFIKSGIASNE